jgi:hypothetical protein
MAKHALRDRDFEFKDDYVEYTAGKSDKALLRLRQENNQSKLERHGLIRVVEAIEKGRQTTDNRDYQNCFRNLLTNVNAKLETLQESMAEMEAENGEFVDRLHAETRNCTGLISQVKGAEAELLTVNK